LIRLKITFIILLMPLFLLAQTNLVPNPGFESYTSCPQFPPDGNINRAFPWFQPWTDFNSSDFFHACDTIDQMMSVPSNFWGYQWPHTGDGYSGILCYYSSFPNPPINSREYLEVELTDSLTAGFTYNVSFYVSLSDTSQYACNNIGVHFSDTIILYNTTISNVLLNVPFHVFSQIVVTDNVGWHLVSGKYIASGGEKFMVAGNFLNDISTSFISTGFGSQPWAYYYFDDFNVSLDSSTSLEELSLEDIIISPNPSADVFTISTADGFIMNGNLVISNLQGQHVLSADIRNEKQFTIDLKNFANGVYLLKMQLGERIVIRKLVKM
jgi:hypothetical protein